MDLAVDLERPTAALAPWAASTGGSPRVLLPDGPLFAARIWAGSESSEGAGSMAAGSFSTTAAAASLPGMGLDLGGTTGMIAFTPIAGARGGTTKTLGAAVESFRANTRAASLRAGAQALKIFDSWAGSLADDGFAGPLRSVGEARNALRRVH